MFTLIASGDKIVEATWLALDQVKEKYEALNENAANPVLRVAASQLEEYFQGTRQSFELAFDLRGTDFQKKVWAALQAIPFGETRSYEQIAVQIGNQKACRAVGLANSKNPIAIFTPCHRVVGKSGHLTGFAGGLGAKKLLLELEMRRRA